MNSSQSQLTDTLVAEIKKQLELLDPSWEVYKNKTLVAEQVCRDFLFSMDTSVSIKDIIEAVKSYVLNEPPF